MTLSPFDETTDGCHVFPVAALEVERSDSIATVGCCMEGRVVEVADSPLPVR